LEREGNVSYHGWAAASGIPSFQHVHPLLELTDQPFSSPDTKYEIEQLKIFQTMVEKGESSPFDSKRWPATHQQLVLPSIGLIYRHHRPSYYSPSSRTALAEAELSYKEDHVSRSVYVAFSLDQPSEELKRVLGDEKDVTLPIWTTTAWSLGSNMVDPSLPSGDNRSSTGEADSPTFWSCRQSWPTRRSATFWSVVKRIGRCWS
jgi:hypothetical protein